MIELTRWSRAAFGGTAGLWLAASVLPATTAGSGSTISAHRLADLIASGALAGAAPAWLGLAWYAMPVCAALLLMSLGLAGTVGATVRLAITAITAMSIFGFGALVSDYDPSRVGSSVWCATVGALCAAAVSAGELRNLRRSGAGGRNVLP